MALMQTELYDALKSAGADEAKSRDATSAVGSHEHRIVSLDTRMKTFQWMLGINMAMTMAILFKVFA
jgi:hypothetical protein